MPAFEQTGTGRDLVWLADTGLPGRIWHREQLPAFAEGFRQTTVEHPAGAETVSDCAADCAEVVEAACRAPVVLVGHGFGSLVAQELALERPELVERAVLLATFAHASGYLAELLQGELDGVEGGGEARGPFALIHAAIMGYPPEVLGDVAAWHRARPVAAELAAADPEPAAAQRRAALAFDSRERLPGCRVPLDVVAFGHDLQAPPARGRLVAELAPDSTFHVLPEHAHLSLYRHRAEELNAYLEEVI